MADRPASSSHERILIYDGDCRLCVTAKNGLTEAGDKAGFRFVPYQSEEAARCLAGEYKPGRPDAAFLVEADGRVSRGLDAFLPLLPGLRGGRLGLAVMRIPLFRPLALWLYRLVAKHRYRWFGQVSSGPGRQA